MGLGKTLQSISILVYMKEFQNLTGPHLIVVPKSTLSNWMAELGRWAPTLSAVKFHGTKDEREEMARTVLCPGQRDEERTWNVVVTTYEVSERWCILFLFSFLLLLLLLNDHSVVDREHALVNPSVAAPLGGDFPRRRDSSTKGRLR